MVSKFVWLPMACLFVLSILGMLGLGNASTLGSGDFSLATENEYYYDYTGAPMLYVANITHLPGQAAGHCQPTPWISPITNIEYKNAACWLNGTWYQLTQTAYILFYGPTDYADGRAPVDYQVLINNRVQDATHFGGVNISSSLGMIAIVFGLMALSLIVGIRFLSGGESDTSIGMVLKCTGYLSLWAILSVISLALLLQITTIGPIIYLALTASCTLGLIDSIGSPQAGGSD